MIGFLRNYLRFFSTYSDVSCETLYRKVFGDNTAFKFNGNVRNFNFIDNLPYGCCVEVPVLASRNKLETILSVFFEYFVVCFVFYYVAALGSGGCGKPWYEIAVIKVYLGYRVAKLLTVRNKRLLAIR